MSGEFTWTIRNEKAEALCAAPTGERAFTNRAAWPTGPLPAFGLVSDRLGFPVTRQPAVDAGPDSAPNPA